MQGSARLSKLEKRLRGPWYGAWKLVENLLFTGRSYTLLVPWGHRVLTPWFGTQEDLSFRHAYQTALSAGPMSVSPDRCYLLHHFCRHGLLGPGDIAECGVFQGGTAQLLAQTAQDTGVQPPTLHLFDTFQGMPPDAQPDRDYHGPGDFANTSLEYVQRRLAQYPFAQFHPGLVPETLSEVGADARFVFVHLDMDLYQPTLDACRWFWPRMVPGGLIVFDDYGFYPYRNAARAGIDEWFANQPERPIVLPTGQGLAIKSLP